MKRRYREGPGKYGGARLLSGEFVRNVDLWRKWAATPLPAIHIECVDTPARWTVDADGQRVSQWLESDAPGLGQWLGDVICKYHGAWHVARKELNLTSGQKTTASERAMRLRAEAADRDAAISDRVAEIRATDPAVKDAYIARVLADNGYGGREALRKKIGKLRPKKNR